MEMYKYRGRENNLIQKINRSKIHVIGVPIVDKKESGKK